MNLIKANALSASPIELDKRLAHSGGKFENYLSLFVEKYKEREHSIYNLATSGLERTRE